MDSSTFNNILLRVGVWRLSFVLLAVPSLGGCGLECCASCVREAEMHLVFFGGVLFLCACWCSSMFVLHFQFLSSLLCLLRDGRKYVIHVTMSPSVETKFVFRC